MTMRPALDADRREIDGKAGRISFYVAGEGPPLLLIHSINAAGCAYEVKPIFEHYRASRTVIAPDLPGFGYSDRSRRDYNVGLYVDAIHDLLAVARDQGGGAPVDALALSLSAEFLARAATQAESPPRTLALITPTGFRAGSSKLRGPEGSTRELGAVRAIVNVPLWRRGLYKLLVKPGVIRYFLRRTWGSADIDEGLAAYDDMTTHQPGAENAPLAFLSGALFSGDIVSVYEQLAMPVWLGHGTRGDFSDFSEADWVRARANWRVESFASGALPHFELPALFFERYSAFLESVAQ